MNLLTDIKKKANFNLIEGFGQNLLIIFAEYTIKSMAILSSYAGKGQNDESSLDLMVDVIGIRFIDLTYGIEYLVGFKVDLIAGKGIKDKYYQSYYLI